MISLILYPEGNGFNNELIKQTNLNDIISSALQDCKNNERVIVSVRIETYGD